MWIKLANEYINLEHIIRVRFNKSFKNGTEDWAAELEGFVRGEVQVFLRYRGADAQVLHTMFTQQLAQSGNLQTPMEMATMTPEGAKGTVHDLKLP